MTINPSSLSFGIFAVAYFELTTVYKVVAISERQRVNSAMTAITWHVTYSTQRKQPMTRKLHTTARDLRDSRERTEAVASMGAEDMSESDDLRSCYDTTSNLLSLSLDNDGT